MYVTVTASSRTILCHRASRYTFRMVTETSSTGRESDKFMLRLPDGMRDTLKEQAKANNRSLNAEIVARLEKSLGLPSSPSELPPILQIIEASEVRQRISTINSRIESLLGRLETLHSRRISLETAFRSEPSESGKDEIAVSLHETKKGIEIVQQFIHRAQNELDDANHELARFNKPHLVQPK